MRLAVTLTVLLGGTALAVVSYFVLSAPFGTPTDESFSNPKVDFAPTLFVLGVTIALLSAVVYELMPDRSDR